MSRRRPDGEYAEGMRAFFTTPRMDAPKSVQLDGIPEDMLGAVRGDPTSCVFARMCHRADMRRVLVYRTTTLYLTYATKELIDYNARVNGITGVKVGDLVTVRYINDSSLREQIRLWDDYARDFVPGPCVLLAPTAGNRLRRDKRSATRRERGDARREGREPEVKRTPQWTRVERAHRAALGDGV